MKTRVLLDSEIYPEQIIAHAAADYAALAFIEIEKDEKYFICKFSQCRYDKKQTIQEFLNYLVDLANSSGAI